MVDDFVMRSVYLRPSEDSQLRQLAHELNVTKSDLIRSAIGVKLREWLESNSDELVLRDLTFGRRDVVADRAASVAVPKAAADSVEKKSSATKASTRSARTRVAAE
jgi:hypothetical protein